MYASFVFDVMRKDITQYSEKKNVQVISTAIGLLDNKLRIPRSTVAGLQSNDREYLDHWSWIITSMVLNFESTIANPWFNDLNFYINDRESLDQQSRMFRSVCVGHYIKDRRSLGE